MSELARIKQAMADGEHTDGDLAYVVEQWEAAVNDLGTQGVDLGNMRVERDAMQRRAEAAEADMEFYEKQCVEVTAVADGFKDKVIELQSRLDRYQSLEAWWKAHEKDHGDVLLLLAQAVGEANRLTYRLDALMSAPPEAADELIAMQNGIIKTLESRLDAAEKENAFSRKWIRELRERIEGLMSGDPPAESADGIRLIALADVCEAYEKGVVENPCPYCGGDDRTKCPCDGIF